MVGVVLSSGVQVVVVAGKAVRLVWRKRKGAGRLASVREVPGVWGIFKLPSALAVWMAMPARRRERVLV